MLFIWIYKRLLTLPHNRLLLKVESYGISGKFLGWTKSFLSNREQCVVLNGCKSGWQKVLSGVPQGSILGPLLFTIYVNDLSQSISSSVFMFADDTKLIRPIHTTNDHDHLQSVLNHLLQCCAKWQLNFNISKCKYIHYGKNMLLGDII